MNDLLEILKQNQHLNISYDSEDMIIDLGLYIEQYGNKEVDMYYKFVDGGYPIFVDYLTAEEKQEVGVEDDLKGLNFVKMEAIEALEVFKQQDKIIKK